MNGLALLHINQGHFDDANDLFCDALVGRKKKFGEDHPSTLETTNDLAVLYKVQERYEKVEPLFIEVVEGRRPGRQDWGVCQCFLG